MPFHESKPSRMYAYAALAPTENIEAIEDQLRLACAYRNKLVENERRRREQIQEARRQLFPRIAALEQQVSAADAAIEQARTAMKQLSAQQRRRVRAEPDVQQLSDLKTRRKDLQTQLRGERERAKEDRTLLAAWSTIEEESKATIRRLRAGSSLYWASYLCVEQSVDHGGDAPRFQRYDGTGRLAVQIQLSKPLGTDELLPAPGRDDGDLLETARDTRLQLYRLQRKDVAMRFRIGSVGREPVWATVPFILHRPLPPGAQVKWVYFIRYRAGQRLRSKVVFVLSQDDWPVKHGVQEGRQAHSAGLDVNWRKTEAGLRVAVWHGSDGERGEIVILQDHLQQWADVEAVQAQRADAFNLAREQLVAHLRDTSESIPEWLCAQTATLAQWRSPARLSRLLICWRDQPFPGDEPIFHQLDVWRQSDKRLEQHQTRLRARTERRREYDYRLALQALATRYQTLFVEKLSVAELRRCPQPEEDNSVVVRYRNAAAIGRFLELAKEVFGKERLQKVEAALTTIQHAECGHVNRGIDKGPRLLTCERCGGEFDQDDNAAENLLRLGFALNAGAEAARTA